MTNILITGMSGLIGKAIRHKLENDYTLTALNRSQVAGVTCFQGDIANLDEIRPAFAGQDMVVHLAAKAGGGYSWEEIEQTNVVGTYNVFEAAKDAGVKRIIYASSGSTISGYERDEPYKALVESRYEDVPPNWPMITHETAVRPNGIYASSKVWGEGLARYYADSTAMSMICLRIGLVNEVDRPQKPRDYAVWCSQGDVAQMVERCMIAPDTLKFDIFYAVSNNTWGYRDWSHAHEVVGFTPQDAAEDYR